MEPELHPNLLPLAPLVGTWRGEGQGEYPGSSSFGYREELVIGHVGKPFLTYTQRTRSTVDGTPLHTEVGYLRVPEPGVVELVLAHAFGVTEIAEGSVSVADDGPNSIVTIEVASTDIGLTSSAKDITATFRRWRLVRDSADPTADRIEYTVDMAAVGQPLQHHLAATLGPSN